MSGGVQRSSGWHLSAEQNRLPCDPGFALADGLMYVVMESCARILDMQFIFEVQVKAGYTAEQYADAWVRASRLIQRAPGARGTRLHREIGDPSVLLAIATWASKAERDAMEATEDPEIEKIIAEQAEFVDVRVIGEFEDAQWMVDPDG
jgi:heme-degrading monooxygenase HmoA